MANTNQLALCANCSNELPHPLPEDCPVCGARVANPVSDYFDTPDYLSYQYEDHLKDTGVQKDTSGKSEQIRSQMMGVELKKWLRVCKIDDKVAALSDAKFLMIELLNSEEKLEDIGKLVKIGKEIGELAGSIAEYLKAGGAAQKLPVIIGQHFRDPDEFLDTDTIEIKKD